MSTGSKKKAAAAAAAAAAGREATGEQSGSTPPGEPAQRLSDAVLTAIDSLRADFTTWKSEIMSEMTGLLDAKMTGLDGKIEQISASFKAEISALRNETSCSIKALESTVSAQRVTIMDLEANATSCTDTMAMLQEEVASLKKTVDDLSSLCEDLSARSRRQNLRILSVREGLETSKTPRVFIAQLLKDALALEKLPLVDRAHRALRPRSREGSAPRPFILRLHNAWEHEEILKKAAAQHRITYEGERILIFPDLPPSIVKRRALFKPARDLMRDKPGVRFGTLYPAKLRVTMGGKDLYFTDPDKALKFAKQHFGDAQQTETGQQRSLGPGAEPASSPPRGTESSVEDLPELD